MFVGHNRNSVARLLDVQELLHNDLRIEYVYAISSSSQAPAGTLELLRDHGVADTSMTALPAVGDDCHLVLTASENIDFAATKGPVVLFAHGFGFNKEWPDGHLAGLPRPDALATGRILILLSTSEQDNQLRAAYSGEGLRTQVVGDSTLDQLTASLPLRNRYRRRLGADNRRLIVFASSWGPESGIARHPGLLRTLLAGLPYDSYRLCLVLHPRVWAEHGTRFLELGFSDELDSGAAVLPPEAGWHAALVAADLVLTDHGSLGLYSAGIGRPLLLTEPATETVPGSPVAALHELAPHLDPGENLRAQVDAAVENYDATRYQPVTSRLFEHRGEAADRIQRVLYDLLALEPQRSAPLLRAPDPVPWKHREPAAFRVRLTPASAGGVSVDRRPAAAFQHDSDLWPIPQSEEEWPLVVEESVRDLRCAERASVLCRGESAGAESAWEWTAQTLDAYPAQFAVASVGSGRYAARTRDGRRLWLTTTADVPVTIAAAAAFARVRTESPLATEFPVEFGPHRCRMRIEVTDRPVPPAAG
ncbi:hypothetical protein [Amycolatopsis sp. NPDC003676]